MKYSVIEVIHGLDGKTWSHNHHGFETLEEAQAYCDRFNAIREEAGRSGHFYVKEKK